MASSRNLVSTIGAQASPQRGGGPGVRKGKRSLLACHTRCKCSMETIHNSVKVKLGIKVMKLVESLIGNISGFLFHLVKDLYHKLQQTTTPVYDRHLPAHYKISTLLMSLLYQAAGTRSKLNKDWQRQWNCKEYWTYDQHRQHLSHEDKSDIKTVLGKNMKMWNVYGRKTDGRTV